MYLAQYLEKLMINLAKLDNKKLPLISCDKILISPLDEIRSII